MKLDTLVLSGSLANINVVIINATGEIRVFREGDTLLPGEVILYPNGETEEASVLSVARVDNANEPQNITDDVNVILAALERGQDSTLLDGELAPAAGGQSGSSLTLSGTVSRDGSETIASTNFVTEGFASLGLSETQSLTLLDQFRLAQLPPEFVDINESPLGESITVSTDEDTSISGQLTATDVNDDELTFSTATPPSNGQVTVNPDGSWTYTPDEDFDGNDSFTVVVTDGEGGSDEIEVIVVVNPIPEISVTGGGNVSEGDDAIFTIEFDKPSNQDTTLKLDITPTTAESDDIGNIIVTTDTGIQLTVAPDGTVVVPAGVTNLNVNVETVQDDTYEGDESFILTVDAVDGLVNSENTDADATITDGGENGGNDDHPTVSITETVSVSEGDDAVFTVSLSQAADTDVTVNLVSQTGSASSDDFGAMVVTTADGTVVNPNTDGSYTIPAGETNLTVTIPTTDDTVFEGNEDFTVTATAGDGTVGSDTGTATITDGGENGGNDDRPTISITETVSVSEGDDAVFTVSLSQAADTDVTVNLASQTGSASSDDFGAMVVTTADGTVVNPNTDGSYTIPAGQTNLTVTIPTTNDTVFEGNEDFTVTATAGDGTVGSDTGTATITDGGENGGNDDRPTISITETVSVSEGDDAVFTVSLSQAADTDVTVNLASQTGSASSDDFGTMVVTTADGTVVNPNTDGSYTIPAGQTNLTVTIPTTNDMVFEGNEDFTVTATAGDGTVGSDTGTATITDGGENGGNDDRPTISITETVSVSEGDDAVFTVSLSQAADTDVTVNLASQTGSAEADDFGTMVVTTADGTVVNPNTDGSYTIPAGQTNLTVTIPTTNDTVFEGNEDFTVTATAGDGTVGSDTGTATITDGGENGGNDDRP
ncbi:Calx-beta domain-containing protein, partial [Vibrio sp. TRT 21S02]|uniref:Calx-beta domain-containing protein n=1 Tax=Vibrio sp. TRT 21S02 TaxID=3418507 RepID=UPI003CF1623B